VRTITAPVLLMTGASSPRSSLSVADLLAGALPDVRRVDLPGLGHMGPVTHPDPVNAEIERFLQEVAR
jgi:pimeloyl-ACP methyl ester carboxylesterase